MKPVGLNKRIMTAGLLLQGTSLTATPASSGKQTFRTSFDCAKVKSDVEIKIRENKQLARPKFNFSVIVGRAFHSIEAVRFVDGDITIRYQSESGVVTEAHESKIAEGAKQ